LQRLFEQAQSPRSAIISAAIFLHSSPLFFERIYMSTSSLVQIIFANLLPSTISLALAASIVAQLHKKNLHHLISYATGLLLAMALLNLLPEAAEGLEAQGASHTLIFHLLLAGILGFFLLQKFALFRHDHHHEHDGHHHDHGFDQESAGKNGWMILIGSGFHNFADGLLIAAAFLTSPELGWAAALAVGLHEVVHKLSDFAVLLNAGFSRKRAFFYNFASGLSSVAGGVLGYFILQDLQNWIPYVLVVSASSFLYIAVADLIPQMNIYKSMRQGLVQITLLLLGVATIWLLSGEHEHEHHAAHIEVTGVNYAHI
jgi:zinc and cadmium transporter